MMRIGIIGASGHYGYALDHLEGAMVAGIAPGAHAEDLTPLRMACGRLGQAPREYADALEMLREERPQIAVINPVFCDMAELACEAMKRGIAVFMDKPVALTLESLDRVKATQRSESVPLTAMFGIRYTPWFWAAKRAVEAGRIGEVRLISAQKSYRLGTRPGFYADRAAYGGTIPWIAIHALDWASWMAGRRYRSVSAMHSAAGNRGNGGMEVSAAILARMQDDVIVSVTADYLRPAASARHDDDRIRLTGVRGTIEVRDQEAWLETEEQGLCRLPLEACPSLFSEFMAEVAGEGPCGVSAEQAFEMTRVALLARDSADQGGIQVPC